MSSSSSDTPSIRSDDSNLFIKNLDKSIDNKALFDAFSAFGNILSCKVARDEDSISKGHGFVQFETEEAADNAIAQVNGMELNGRKVYVGKFIPREERETMLREKGRRFNNVYIKNFEEDIGDAKLREMFETYGKITSVKVMTDESGKSKHFGFVSFENPDHAQKAVEDLNGKEMNGKPLYVGRAQKKRERQIEMKKRLELLEMERKNRYSGINLYVKNLDPSVDDELLEKEFSTFGTITSAKVMTDSSRRSKNFGFVCFSNPEDAQKALAVMNGHLLLSKPLYVSVAQTKTERKQMVVENIRQRIAHMEMQKQLPQMLRFPHPGFFPCTMPHPNRGFFPPPLRPAQCYLGWPSQPHIRASTQEAAAYLKQVNRFRAPLYPAATALQNVGINSLLVSGQQSAVAAASVLGPTAARPTMATASNVSQGRPIEYIYSPNVRNQPQPVSVPQSSTKQTVASHDQMPLTDTVLAGAVVPNRKKLRERLYPVVNRCHPEMAGKIVKILLKTENVKLWRMLEHHEALSAKIEEAVSALQASRGKKALSAGRKVQEE